MLSVTQPALSHLSGILSGHDDERNVLRLTATQDGLALVADETRSGDEVHEHDGNPVLVLDERVANAIGDRTLDIKVEDGSPRLTLI